LNIYAFVAVAVFTDLQIKIRSFELIIAHFRSTESEGERWPSI